MIIVLVIWISDQAQTMNTLKADLSNLESTFPKDFTPDQIAKAKTVFYKKLALLAHSFYGGKIQVVPRAPVPGLQLVQCLVHPGRVEHLHVDSRQ